MSEVISERVVTPNENMEPLIERTIRVKCFYLMVWDSDENDFEIMDRSPVRESLERLESFINRKFGNGHCYISESETIETYTSVD